LSEASKQHGHMSA